MQALALLAFLVVGVLVCAWAGRALTIRWRLPWRESLMYFGLVPYPHEGPVDPSRPARRR